MNVSITFRLDETEKDAIQKEAEKLGMKMSEYIRIALKKSLVEDKE